jgi:hypothetical protein
LLTPVPIAGHGSVYVCSGGRHRPADYAPTATRNQQGQEDGQGIERDHAAQNAHDSERDAEQAE